MSWNLKYFKAQKCHGICNQFFKAWKNHGTIHSKKAMVFVFVFVIYVKSWTSHEILFFLIISFYSKIRRH